MNREEAERIVADAYMLMLGRAPDEDGASAHAGAILAGDLDGFGLVQSLAQSEEGVLISKRQSERIGPDAAEALQTAIFLRELHHAPDEIAVEALREQAGNEMLSVEQVYQIVIATPEFAARQQGIIEECQQILLESYELALGRQPDPEGIQANIEALASGTTDGYRLLISLLRSEERRQREVARKLLITPDVARDCLVSLFLGLLGREPELAAIEALERRVDVEHVTVSQLCVDIVNSPEFAARARHLPAVAEFIAQQAQPSGASEEIVLLIQELIGERLIESGCLWALPPIFPEGRIVPANQVSGLIRTLAMLRDAAPH